MFPRLALGLCAAAVALASLCESTARAQSAAPSPVAKSILDALKGGSDSRGGAARAPATAAPSVAARGVLDKLIDKSRARGLSEPELEELGDIAETRRSIDLTVYFDFNSTKISQQAMPTVMALGEALSDPSLKGSRFLLGGHTDGKGSVAYNQTLSERRAQAIRRFLIERFRLPEDRLMAAGFGRQRLKNRANPFADENRRVQVVNLDASK